MVYSGFDFYIKLNAFQVDVFDELYTLEQYRLDPIKSPHFLAMVVFLNTAYVKRMKIQCNRIVK